MYFISWKIIWNSYIWDDLSCNYAILYKKILATIFQWTADQACKHILELYEKKGFCIVDYLYFANISAKKLFVQYTPIRKWDSFRNALLAEYKTTDIQDIRAVYQQAILDADLVLMDGIALQIFYFLAKRKRLDNLNGTDFCPYFLSYITQKHRDKKMNIILYGTYPHLLERTKQFLMKQWYNVVYAQDWYTNLNWENIELSLKWRDKDINILLNARSTPDYPIQELWTLSNKDTIRKHWLIVLNQWGTFDFRVGEQKRAPKFVRKLKLEWLWRLIATPKRQIKKTLDSLAIIKYIFVYLILKKH